MVLDLYYMLDPRNYATIAYEVINVPHVGNDPYGNGDYGSTDPTFELIASGPTGKPLGTKVTVPDGYEFLGWFTSIVDLQGGKHRFPRTSTGPRRSMAWLCPPPASTPATP